VTANPETHPSETQARRLENVHEQLTTALHQPEVAQRLRATPGENEWSAMQVMGHMAEMIPYWLNQCQRLIAATVETPHFGRTLEAPERLAGVERGTTGELDKLLSQLKDEIQGAANTIRHMSAVERSKTGLHLRRGVMTVAEVIEVFIVSHAEEHLKQVQETLRV